MRQFHDLKGNDTDNLQNNHANTHLALTVGAAQRYEVVGDRDYLHATSFFYDTLLAAHSYTTGGSNFREFWQQAHEQGAAVMDVLHSGGGDDDSTFVGHDNEESCTTYNFLKISRLISRQSWISIDFREVH